MAGHTAGDPLECYGIPIVLHKEPMKDENSDMVFGTDGRQKYRCGFKIGGGIDQDPFQSPQGYPDKGIYVTFVYENSPAQHAGLQLHDKLLQVNGHDMTVVTHKKAVEYIQRKPVLNMLVYRKGVPPLQKPMAPQPQFQVYPQGGAPQQQFQQQQQQQFNQFQGQQPQFQRQY